MVSKSLPMLAGKARKAGTRMPGFPHFPLLCSGSIFPSPISAARYLPKQTSLLSWVLPFTQTNHPRTSGSPSWLPFSPLHLPKTHALAFIILGFTIFTFGRCRLVSRPPLVLEGLLGTSSPLFTGARVWLPLTQGFLC